MSSGPHTCFRQEGWSRFDRPSDPPPGWVIVVMASALILFLWFLYK